MAHGPLQPHTQNVSSTSSLARRIFTVAAAGAAALVLLATASFSAAPASASTADHLMCGWKVAPRTQTVSIDPNMAAAGVTTGDVIAAFEPWNALYMRYYGFPIFTVYYGNWWEADILVSDDQWDRTWVQTPCSGAAFEGNLHTKVWLGSSDAWRNAGMLSHELGHALGFADHGSVPADHGHVGYKPCGSYIGVMSYCTSPQSWFMDRDLSSVGLTTDGQLVRNYWQP